MNKEFSDTSLKSSRNFTLIELVLVMVIITFSFMGVTTITSVGIDVGSEAMANGITTDAAEQFLRFNAGKIREDWSWLDLFPKTKVLYDDSVMSDDTDLIWTNTTILENDSVKVKFVADYSKKNSPFNPVAHRQLHDDDKLERSVFLCEQTSEGYKKFLVSMRVWKETTTLDVELDPEVEEDDVVLSAPEEAVLYVEASYPATQPYEQRYKEIYSLQFFKVPEIVLSEDIPFSP